jgi:hypothetical protein
MKVIMTTNRGGVARATDNDGNRFQLSSFHLGYDEGHRAACELLCRKMGWTGTYHGGYVLKAGNNVGMVWVPEDSRYIVVAS